MMLVCCNKPMKVDKNGVGVDMGDGHVYPGDRYVCLACKRTVVKTMDLSLIDPKHELFSEYITLKEKFKC